ncbi:2-C-methyl-D-erythritol 2,4-cyclodiphosphate synthase [Parasporobacterium paucivorans DSM 15970]|uniref:2-C-methyl-D-erythritol 2,4-cyclodiphosphate synthase n=1 Tax=Parasporobacterium paucivorans DSM 15970 TaxID=1122934 RepID=A0A1M6FQE1_9FIRM|nr:2-C-methyl-D-erythritol 2,4-cyclodiphosphate synthase [Parasporobacterium paucivorans]SHI99883.1 2-C-methyl-D-erythritol 2,4-cyclodiphosphate synthase [Parasporobacterium paucivorans DSM 15970]
MRVGMGYDVHRLVEGRRLILGGVEIPYERGLEGHSDADVVTHAVMDALLGAAGLGDIGEHFPDSDEQYRNISSIRLLEKVGDKLRKKWFQISNIDATIIAQHPKLSPYKKAMIKNISAALGIPENQINIKATTEEGMGFTGNGEGISAHAITLLTENSPEVVYDEIISDSRRLHELKSVDYNMLKWYFSLRHPGTCESVILDAYLWRHYYNTRYYFNDKGLMWIFTNKDEVFTNIPLCRNEDLQECFEDVQDYFNTKLGMKLRVYLADEEAVDILNLPEDKYIVEEDRRYFDYIYDAESLRNLAGRKFHKKKNHVNSFKKEYEGRYEFKRLGCENILEILVFLKEWNAERDIEDEYNRVDYELLGIESVLKNCQILKFRMGGIYLDGKLEAFSMGSYADEEKTAYIHIEKANPRINGLYAFINQQFLINLFPEAEKVNREDDMGLEGLRKAKLSYQPIALVKKFNIIQK